MNHFIMGNGKDKVLAEGIEQTKGELVMIVAAENGIQGSVRQHIIHPAHIPFKVES